MYDKATQLQPNFFAVLISFLSLLVKLLKGIKKFCKCTLLLLLTLQFLLWDTVKTPLGNFLITLKENFPSSNSNLFPFFNFLRIDG